MGLFADEYCCAWLRFSLLHTFTECLLLISINPAPRASFSEIIPYYGAGQRHHSAHDLVELNDATDRTLPQSRRSFDRACSLLPTNSRLSRV